MFVMVSNFNVRLTALRGERNIFMSCFPDSDSSTSFRIFMSSEYSENVEESMAGS